MILYECEYGKSVTARSAVIKSVLIAQKRNLRLIKNQKNKNKRMELNQFTIEKMSTTENVDLHQVQDQPDTQTSETVANISAGMPAAYADAIADAIRNADPDLESVCQERL